VLIFFKINFYLTLICKFLELEAIYTHIDIVVLYRK